MRQPAGPPVETAVNQTLCNIPQLTSATANKLHQMVAVNVCRSGFSFKKSGQIQIKDEI